MSRSLLVRAALFMAMLGGVLIAPIPVRRVDAATALPCQGGGSWTAGEVTLYWFDVDQGDSQLLVGPTGRTLLIDLGESAFNSHGTTTNAYRVGNTIKQICNTGGAPVALDYVMVSHQHLDHIGYAGNPEDSQAYGNGLYQLLTPESVGGMGFTVGTFLDRDAGGWIDANGDGHCSVGTSATPSNEVAWHNAGVPSQTMRRLICWLYGPPGQPDRANVEGRVVQITNTAPYPAVDLGPGVSVQILNANGRDSKEADGVTAVAGDHTNDATPPSENDYSVAVKVSYGRWLYATAGDSDGEFSTSAAGYVYNRIEDRIGPLFGDVDTMRANHHGSHHSSSQGYVNTLKPETVFISCGDNNFGHPGNEVLDELRRLVNDRGVGADIYLANNPCDPMQSDGVTATDYTGTLNRNGDVVLRTTGAGTGYTISYDSGSRAYTAYGTGPTATPTSTPTATPTTTPTTTPTATPTSTPTTTPTAIPTATSTATPTPTPAGPAVVRINEFLMAPQTAYTTEWVELYNPASNAIDVGGLYIDDLANGGGAPKQIPAGTIVPARGYYVMDIASGFLNNTGAESVRFLQIVGGVETVYDQYDYSLASTHYDQSFHRQGDGGAWCATVSTNVTRGAANAASCP
ncbi:MAG TPA: hypothetical protein VGL23_12930 [Chloroflexota bacterium]